MIITYLLCDLSSDTKEVEQEVQSVAVQAQTGLSLPTRLGLVAEQVAVAQAVVWAERDFGGAVVVAVESEPPQG